MSYKDIILDCDQKRLLDYNLFENLDKRDNFEIKLSLKGYMKINVIIEENKLEIINIDPFSSFSDLFRLLEEKIGKDNFCWDSLLFYNNKYYGEYCGNIIKI